MTDSDSLDNLSHSDHLILLHKLKVQEDVVSFQIILAEEELSLITTPEAWKFLDGLKEIRNSLRTTKRNVEKITPPKKTIKDRIRYRLYLWSVKERFKQETL